MVGVATAVGTILRGGEDREWPVDMPSKPSLPRGTILYDQKERAELIQLALLATVEGLE